MAYTKDGNSLLTQVVDIPMGGGKDEKTQKHLFNPPFVAEASNVEVAKTGSVQKRDGVQKIVTVPNTVQSGTVFEHPGGQLGVVGASNYSYAAPTAPSVGVIKNSSDPATSNFVSSNDSGIYACNMEESPVTRSDEAILHTQTSVSGNKIITVWCVQYKPVTQTNLSDVAWVTDNRCYYSVRERDTNTITVQPTEIVTFRSINPRYTHISLVDQADPHWVIVAAPEVHPEVSWQKLYGASVSASTEQVVTTAALSFVDGQTSIENFVAFDMHSDSTTNYAHIIAQEGTVGTHGPYLFRIDKTLTASLFRLLTVNEVPLHSGAVLEVSGNGVFTAVSNQDSIVGARAGDGQTWVHRYDEAAYTPQTGYPKVVLAQTNYAAPQVNSTGACTRLTLGLTSTTNNGTIHVYGTQFWNPAGYKMLQGSYGSFSSATEDIIQASESVYGTKSWVRTVWSRIDTAFSDTPGVLSGQGRGSCFLITKAFKKGASHYPMVGVSVTNGQPATSLTLAELTKTDGPGRPKYTPPRPVSPQPSKHPMGLVVCPQYDRTDGEFGDVEKLRAICRFGVDKVEECDDVFPFEWGKDISAGTQTNLNAPSRWLAPGLSYVAETEISGEVLFSYRSKIRSGVQRKPGYNRLAVYGVGGTYFTDNPNNAYGGDEVRVNFSDFALSDRVDSVQTYFSGGYFGVFDGVFNGESDPHSSPGRPFVALCGPSGGGIYPEIPLPASSYPDEATYPVGSAGSAVVSQNARFQGCNSPLGTDINPIEYAYYTFVLVYAILDEDGRFHRSAPSPAFTTWSIVSGPTDNYCAVVRYLQPPPSAFEGLGDKTLYLEVYMKARDLVNAEAPDNGPARVEFDVTNYTLIDRFIPEAASVANLTEYSNSSSASPNLTGTILTPFEHTASSDVRSGFSFFGERIVFQPKHRKNSRLIGGTQTYVLDAGQLTDTVLYTTGGVLENDPPPAFVDIQVVNKRMWGIPINGKSEVWYSKLLTPGKPPEWSAAFTIALPRGAEKMTSISSMDEKVVLFSRDDIFILVGEGPNNLGRGGSFTGPRRVAADVGCVNRKSVVSGPFGVLFQSAKGIYVLSRDLQVSYIGSKVEDQITSDNDITSAVLVEDKNQVRFYINQPAQTRMKCLVFDYYHNLWTVFKSDSTGINSTVSATLFSNKAISLGYDNVISGDKEGSFFDGEIAAQQSIVSKFTTAWIKLAGLQGFKRVKRSFFLGQHLGGKVSLSAQYNYNEGVSTTKSWTDAEIVALSTDPMQLGLHIPRQKCESIRFVYSDEDAGAAAAAGDIISSITIQFGAKNGMYKMSEGSKK